MALYVDDTIAKGPANFKKIADESPKHSNPNHVNTYRSSLQLSISQKPKIYISRNNIIAHPKWTPSQNSYLLKTSEAHDIPRMDHTYESENLPGC